MWFYVRVHLYMIDQKLFKGRHKILLSILWWTLARIERNVWFKGLGTSIRERYFYRSIINFFRNFICSCMKKVIRVAVSIMRVSLYSVLFLSIDSLFSKLSDKYELVLHQVIDQEASSKIRNIQFSFIFWSKKSFWNLNYKLCTQFELCFKDKLYFVIK